ncbi:2OG-Fe(II) oxygenase [Ralstonia pseudosolanacearum]|uniref:2OG-Fe(II) oxygenase n=1 Tax=Ralstonia pseudosolanacearum TaxID=1310165 RepID=UPI003CF493D9
MSSIALHQGGLLVADGLLGANALATLRDHVAQSDYRGVHGQKWDRVWRLWDGNPQRGPSVYYDPDGRFDWKGPAYPTGTVVDQLIDTVRTLSALHPDVAGAECVDWAGIYLCPWLYPVGSALSLHQDAARYTGSFAFFLHARWRLHWGGELFVYPPASPAGLAASPALGGDLPWISDDGPDEAMISDVALAIAPSPNRLVLLGEDRPHRVARVDQNAGAHVRVSIAGFFLRAP